jgi:8-oxo-dGTP pyrophosphatase MutT (NUDIX family)
LTVQQEARSQEATDFSLPDFRQRALARLHRDAPRFDPAAGIPAGDHAFWRDKIPSEKLLASAGAAVLVPVVARAEGATVLLTQRSSALRKHSGQIAFPGGRIDADETAIAAALREAEEEIGLAARHIEPIGFMDCYFTGTGFCITPVVAVVSPPFELTINPHEVDDAFEVPLSFLMRPENHQRFTRREDGRAFLAMPYGDRYIWGATAGMLRHLYERLYV